MVPFFLVTASAIEVVHPVETGNILVAVHPRQLSGEVNMIWGAARSLVQDYGSGAVVSSITTTW